jgi:hypothetical protein
LLVALLLLTALVIFSSGAEAEDQLLAGVSPESVGLSSQLLTRFDTLAIANH